MRSLGPLYYLVAKLVNKYNVDFENDPTFTGFERDVIRQGLRDLVYYSPYQAEGSREVAARSVREPTRKAQGK